MKIYSFILFMIFHLSAIAQIDTLKSPSQYDKCIDSSILILKHIKDGKYSEVQKLLPNNVRNQPYFNKKYFKKELRWADSIIEKNGLPSRDNLLILKKNYTSALTRHCR